MTTDQISPDSMRPGEVYGFKTSGLTGFSPADTGRYAALKIGGRESGLIFFILFDGVFHGLPGLAEIELASYLTTGGHGGPRRPYGCFVKKDWECGLQEMRLIGRISVTDEDRALMLAHHTPHGPKCRTWDFASACVEARWRHANDQQSLHQEFDRQGRAEAEEWKAALQRHPWLRDQDPRWKWLNASIHPIHLPHWRQPPHPDGGRFTRMAEERLDALVSELSGLEGANQTLGRKEARQALRMCVIWFNDENRKSGHTLQAQERQDLYETFELILAIAGHLPLLAEIEHWRRW
ncbi:MAG: hypothetical protein KTR21_01795 [Rhodobacteraceae bacterium]|nr:hypothetical protein [Paracoccaceae bacterium]